jgi:hypothetical protein
MMWEAHQELNYITLNSFLLNIKKFQLLHTIWPNKTYWQSILQHELQNIVLDNDH